MFEEYDFDMLVERMLSNVSDEFDKREGSVIYDAVAPIALELANFYAILDMIINEVFADTASYYYLIKRAAERGIYPNEETYAVCKMEVQPTDTPVSIGDRFNCDTLNYTVTSIIDKTAGVYQLTCETAGVVGNQQLGDLLAIETVNDINDMQSARITEILIPGEDEEDVETFRERYFASLSSEAFGGNKADYVATINALDGIGGCKVLRAWEGGYRPADMRPGIAVQEWMEQQSEESLGSEVYAWLSTVYRAANERLLTTGGTIKCYIINSEYRAPSLTLIKSVQDALDPTESSGEGDGLAPIGHVVRVHGVREVVINVNCSITYREGFSFSSMQESIHETIDAYFLELAKTWAESNGLVVRTSQIAARLLLLEGIIDVSGVQINGAADNITLDKDAIPVRGDING